eukprot:CFRG4985T1
MSILKRESSVPKGGPTESGFISRNNSNVPQNLATGVAVASINDFAAYDPSEPNHDVVLDADVDNLFKTKSIADIKILVRETRSECEQKKEELRLMVGERYRDMIEAADTILDMRSNVNSVVESIRSLQDQCQKIASTSGNPAHEQAQPALHGHGRYLLSQRSMTREKADTQRSIFYSVATQMKLLVDAPEHLWNALEQRQYLKAAKLYLLSKHICDVLLYNQSVSSSLRVNFPILKTQWDSMSGLKTEISSRCATELRHCHVHVNHVTSNLLSLILLDELSPQDVLERFLKIRLGSIQDTLSRQGMHNPVHLRLLQCVEVVRLTLDHIYPMFIGSAEGDPPLLYGQLQQHAAEREHRTKEEFQDLDMTAPPTGVESDISDATLSELFGYNSNTLTLFRHLPLTMQLFKPSLPRARHVRIPLAQVRSLCQEWLIECTESIALGVPNVLPTQPAAATQLPGNNQNTPCITLSHLDACQEYILQVISKYCDPNYIPANTSSAVRRTHFPCTTTKQENNANTNLGVDDTRTNTPAPTFRNADDLYDEMPSTPWDTVCVQVLGNTVDLWDTLLRKPMLAQAQAALSENFACVSPLVMKMARRVTDRMCANESVQGESINDLNAGESRDGSGESCVGPDGIWIEEDVDLLPMSKSETTLIPEVSEFLHTLKRGQLYKARNYENIQDKQMSESQSEDEGVDLREFALPDDRRQTTTYLTLKASSLTLPVYEVVSVFDLLIDAILYDAQGYLGQRTYADPSGARKYLQSLSNDRQTNTYVRNKNDNLMLKDPIHVETGDTRVSNEGLNVSESGGDEFLRVGKVWLESIDEDARIMSARVLDECSACVQDLSNRLEALLVQVASSADTHTGKHVQAHLRASIPDNLYTNVNGGGGKSEDTIKKVLIISDIARAIADFSMKIPSCVVQGSRQVKQTYSQSNSRSLKRVSSVPLQSLSGGLFPSTSEAKALVALTAPLKAVCASGVDVWQEWALQLSLVALRESITLDMYTTPITMAWEDVKLDESNEDGQSVESSIMLPCQPHPLLLHFLFTVCELLSRAGGYGWEPHNSARLRQVLCKETLDIISTFSTAMSLQQQGAIQLLFDLSIFVAFVTPRESQAETFSITALVQRIETQIQSKIDPFDLSVLLPHLTTNIRRCCRQLSTLLGLLDAGANHAISQHKTKQQISKKSKLVTGGGSLDIHNVLTLANAPVRFGTLAVAPLPNEIGISSSNGKSLPTQKPLLNVTRSLKTLADNHDSELRTADSSSSYAWSSLTTSSVGAAAVGEQASQWVQKVGLTGGESIRNFLWGGQESSSLAPSSQAQTRTGNTLSAVPGSIQKSQEKAQTLGFDLGSFL